MRQYRLVLVAVLVAVFATSAQALPITDVYTPPGSPITLNTDTPYAYQHNLLDDGFDPVLDTLTSVTLTLSVSGPGGQPLTITVDGGSLFSGQLNTLLGVGGQPLAVSLALLQSDGLLNVTLTKGGGAGSTFSFTSSTLFADGTRWTEDEGTGDTYPGTSIPEPGLLALLGAGLAGAGRRYRRSPAR